MSERSEPYSLSAPAVQIRRWSSTDWLMLSAVAIWGINYTVMKVALTSFSPLAFTTVRFSLATITILAILLLRGESLSMVERDVPAVFVMGLCGHTLYQLLFVKDLARSSPGNASLLMATSPIFVAVMGHFTGVERAHRMVWAGIILSFVGISLLILGGPDGTHLGGGTMTGDVMILASSVLWAFYTTSSKRLLTRYSALKLTAMAMLAGTLPLALISLPQLASQDWGKVPAGHWVALVFSSVFAMVVGYTIWSISVQRVGNARTAIYSNVTPVIAILVAWVVLGSHLALVQVLGGLVVLAGLLMTRRGRAR